MRPGVGTTDTLSRRRRVLTWVLFGGLTMLLANAIVGENGYLATLRLNRTEAELTATLTRVRLENQQLQDERRRLESDPQTLEQAIREELGYIRPGETTVIVHDTPAIPPAPPR
jgi:cell division protein FtsB